MYSVFFAWPRNRSRRKGKPTNDNTQPLDTKQCALCRRFPAALLPLALRDALPESFTIGIRFVRVEIPVLVGQFGLLNILRGGVLGRGGLEGGDLASQALGQT